MNPAKITRIEDSQIKTSETIDQTILSYMYYTSRTQDNGEFQKMTSSFRRDSADFDGNVVITLSPSQDNEVLNLTFFLVLTNRREFYPRRTLKSKISSLRGHRKRTLSSSPKAGRASESSDEMQFNGKCLSIQFNCCFLSMQLNGWLNLNLIQSMVSISQFYSIQW